jgi:hypothetical protein
VTAAPPYPGVWKEGEFQGLKTGVATLVDVQCQFGSAPFDVASREDSSQVCDWYFYTFTEGPLAGEGAVEVDKKSGIVRRVILWGLQRELAIRDIERLFGKQYIITRYSSDECLYEGESGPVYENAAGQHLFYEFRSQGIAASVNDNGAVGDVVFGAVPVGAVKSQCAGARDGGRLLR